MADASREVRKAWQYDHDQLKASHEAQDQRAYDETKAKSAEIWEKDLSQSGQDFENTADRRKDKPQRKKFSEKMRETTTDQERKEIRDKARARTKRQRNRSRGRGRTLDK